MYRSLENKASCGVRYTPCNVLRDKSANPLLQFMGKCKLAKPFDP